MVRAWDEGAVVVAPGRDPLARLRASLSRGDGRRAVAGLCALSVHNPSAGEGSARPG